MSNLKKIIISLPEILLTQVDNLAGEQSKNRSELIREALNFYLEEQNKKKIRQELIQGYREMGEINLVLSEEGIGADLADIEQYETKLI